MVGVVVTTIRGVTLPVVHIHILETSQQQLKKKQRKFQFLCFLPLIYPADLGGLGVLCLTPPMLTKKVGFKRTNYLKFIGIKDGEQVLWDQLVETFHERFHLFLNS